MSEMKCVTPEEADELISLMETEEKRLTIDV